MTDHPADSIAADRQNLLLQEQNRVMHDELERLYKARLQLEDRLEQLGQGIDSYQRQIGDYESRLDAQAGRMAAKDRALETAGARIRELEILAHELTRQRDRESDRGTASASEQAAQIAGLESEIARLHGSVSMRIMAPLRRLRALIGGGGA